jgi:hypothetical protein
VANCGAGETDAPEPEDDRTADPLAPKSSRQAAGQQHDRREQRQELAHEHHVGEVVEPPRAPGLERLPIAGGRQSPATDDPGWGEVPQAAGRRVDLGVDGVSHGQPF